MAPKPGLMRAIPMSIIGFVIAALLVTALRAAQSLDPVFDPGVTLVLAPFFVTGFFLWGMGGFDPKMSEHHAHEPEGGLVTALVVGTEDHEQHHEEPVAPVTLLGFEIWRIFTLTLLLLVALFALALLSGLRIRTVGQAEADIAEFAQQVTFALPLGLGTFEGSQLAVFLGFIFFTMLSLFIFAGLIGGLMLFLSRNVEQARATKPTEKDLTPPAPARLLGSVAGSAARGLRSGLPKFFGNK